MSPIAPSILWPKSGVINIKFPFFMAHRIKKMHAVRIGPTPDGEGKNLF
jgi:hypothetical protein